MRSRRSSLHYKWCHLTGIFRTCKVQVRAISCGFASYQLTDLDGRAQACRSLCRQYNPKRHLTCIGIRVPGSVMEETLNERCERIAQVLGLPKPVPNCAWRYDRTLEDGRTQHRCAKCGDTQVTDELFGATESRVCHGAS